MPLPAKAFVRLRVEEFELDLRSREMRRNGEKIKLQGRPFQILTELVLRPGEVVSREEIRRQLWPNDTFVDFEHSINTAINKLREAFGDDAENPRFIETLPRVGYRFIARVENVGTEAATLPTATDQREVPLTDSKRWQRIAVAGFIGALLAIATLSLLSSSGPRKNSETQNNVWTHITDFNDSATSPALSRDGRMIAFIRGPETFVTPGQIYVKMLPDGQPVQLTHDDAPKMAPTFSPDGTRVAYTAIDKKWGWNTWVVPVLGGEPEELLPNAAALTWVGQERVMFSEIKTGIHMGIATATESRAGERDIYLPADLGMAHRSWVSPDGKWVLVSEMDSYGWRPCRMVPSDGSNTGQTVGPNPSRCTSAGWSPDGRTMYFTADAGDGFHIWRQRFPSGTPEQLTFGPTEEEGIAIAPDGASLLTSAGMLESAVWVHDSHGDRQVSGEGFASLEGLGMGGSGSRRVFSPDGKKIYYLIRKQRSRAFKSGQLWLTDLDSGRAELALPGISMFDFDIAPDGNLVTYAAPDQKGNAHIWLAPLDRSAPPKQLTPMIGWACFFGSGNTIYFRGREGEQESIYAVGLQDFTVRKVSPQPGTDLSPISAYGGWWLLGFTPVVAVAKEAGSPIQICTSCSAGWGPDGRFFYLFFRGIGFMGGNQTVALALPPGRELPRLPEGGVKSAKDLEGLDVAAQMEMKGITIFAPGPDPSIYAYVRATVQRNLFRIPLQ